MGREDRRGLITEGRMRARDIVDVGPVGKGLARMLDAEKQGLVQQLVTYPAVEGFALPIQHGLAGRNAEPLRRHRLGPNDKEHFP